MSSEFARLHKSGDSDSLVNDPSQQFVHRETGIEPAALAVPDAEIILRFLDALEKDRGNAVASRNLRLTAIRSFYHMVALRDPASVGVGTRVWQSR
jgi:hypothetical protein